MDILWSSTIFFTKAKPKPLPLSIETRKNQKPYNPKITKKLIDKFNYK